MLNECDTLHGPMEFYKAVEQMRLSGEAKTCRPQKPYFRPGTELPVITVNFVFQGNGMGDYIGYLPALRWNALNSTNIHGRVFVMKRLVELVSNFLHQFCNWEVFDIDMLNKMNLAPSVMRGPGITMNGVKYSQLANGTGGHLVDLGFIYFCNMFPTPKGWDTFPVLKFVDEKIPHGLDPKSYIVLTPGAVADNRSVPGHAWNPMIDWAQNKGLTPVVLGVSEISKNFKVKYSDGLDYKRVLNLIDKTTVMEAALIMKHSAATVGLDNGLINVAACTNAPIVAGYSMVHPDDRRPKRVSGKWEEIFIPREELACTGCQTYMKNLFPHTFNHCLYGDNACIELLFKDNSRLWIEALDRITS